jgi:hypothetical protein
MVCLGRGSALWGAGSFLFAGRGSSRRWGGGFYPFMRGKGIVTAKIDIQSCFYMKKGCFKGMLISIFLLGLG